MQQLTHNGTQGRSYGGDPNLIHIPDHHREDVGKAIADTLTAFMRTLGTLGVGHEVELYDADKPLCPGCYMIALFDAAVELAKREGQPVKELGLSMAQLFTKLAEEGAYRATEEMTVISAPAVSFPTAIPSGELIPKRYIGAELTRNKANTELFREMVRIAYGRNDPVMVGHHIGFEIGDDFTTENEIPSADTLIFDHDIMRAVFGERYIDVMIECAKRPVGMRDECLKAHFLALAQVTENEQQRASDDGMPVVML